jgi:neurofibromin 1
VEALSRLISANPESGVKHSLSMAYDPDPRQRLIFSYVFARVMGQGAKFEAQETPVNFSGRSRLCEVCVPRMGEVLSSVLIFHVQLVKGPDVCFKLTFSCMFLS